MKNFLDLKIDIFKASNCLLHARHRGSGREGGVQREGGWGKGHWRVKGKGQTKSFVWWWEGQIFYTWDGKGDTHVNTK